jgi:DNA-binding GntR family transcriptional regulator
VTRPSRDELSCLYQAREAVEGYAAGLVSEADPAALERVEEELAALRRPTPGVVESFHANHANRRVHRSIVEATGNRILVDLFDAVWNRPSALRLFGEFYVQAQPTTNDLATAHEELLQALGSGDPGVGAKAMIEHIREGRASHPQA